MTEGELFYVALCAVAMLVYGAVLLYYGITSNRHPQGDAGALPPHSSHDSHGH